MQTSLHFSASTKKRRANPHQCRSLFNSDLEIPGHPHRKLLQLNPRMLPRQLIPQFAQPPKTNARRLRILIQRRNRHQPANLNVLRPRRALQRLPQIIPRRIKPRLRHLITQLYFEQHRKPSAEIFRRIPQPL